MKTILHIGSDKAGSTAIQVALYRNRDWFLQRKVYIPKTGLGVDNGHADLLEKLDSKRLDDLAEELACAQAEGFQVALVSWEGMCRFSARQIKTLSNALPANNVNVLIYLREQAEVIQSAHLQWVQMNAGAIEISSLASPLTLFQKAQQALFLRQPKRNYSRLLKRWLKYHPTCTVSAREFNSSQLYHGDVVRDLINHIGLTFDERFLLGETRTNPSLDIETALLLEKWRRQDISERDLDTRLDIAMAIAHDQRDGSRHFFDQRAIEIIRNHHRSTNISATSLERVDAPKTLFVQRDCWRQEPWIKVVERSKEREKMVQQEALLPTLWAATSGASLPDDLGFENGWSSPEFWGVWSNADTSTLRFRLPDSAFQYGSDAIELQISGKYYGNNTATFVTINDLEYGLVDLSDPNTKICVPNQQIGTLRHVEIQLKHQFPTCLGQAENSDDRREIAFAIQSMTYHSVRQT